MFTHDRRLVYSTKRHRVRGLVFPCCLEYGIDSPRLGIIVDDAIIVGENVHAHQERHSEGLRGSIEGAQEIATPVIFSVLTTVAAFVPMMFLPAPAQVMKPCW